MHLSKTSGISLVALLLLSMAVVVSSTPWDGVPDDPTPAQAMWVDPRNTTCPIGYTFIVDVLVNITDPDGAGPATGMYGYEYKLFWNGSNINLTSITTHVPSGWEHPNGFICSNVTGVWSGGPRDGLSYHFYCYAALQYIEPYPTPFVGVMSLCTYNFSVPQGQTPPINGTLDLQDVTVADDLANKIVDDVPPIGTIHNGTYLLVPPKLRVYVDPRTSYVPVGQTFSINVSVANVTDLVGYEFKFLWNTTFVDCVNSTFNRIWYPNDFIVRDEILDNYNSTHGRYHGAYTAILIPQSFNGSTTLVSLTFKATSSGNCTLDIYDVTLANASTGQAIGDWFLKDSPDDGYVTIGPGILRFSVTWKWLNSTKDPVWLNANVSLFTTHLIENFNFNRSLGQISFNFTSATQGFCNITIPKHLMDGAFKVLINDTQVPCMLTWNKSHTFIYFTHSQGVNNIKIVGEIVTRLRGGDFLSIVDVNGDGIVDIVDIVTLALRFGWEEDC